MISYFPIPFQDETFYSILCRYFFSTLEKSAQCVNEKLFGKRKIQLSYEFPIRINDFVKNVSHLSLVTPDIIINKHSHFNFYKHFISTAHAESVRQKMMSGDGCNINGLIGLNRSDTKPLNSPRYCIQCAENDLTLTKQIYWHRVHQLPIAVCPIHKTYLRDLIIPETTLRSQQYYYVNSIQQLEQLSNTCSNQLLLDLAQMSNDLLADKTKINISKIFYHDSLDQKGFYNGKKLLIDKLVESMISSFGESQLMEWRSISNINLSFRDSILSMIYKGEKIFNPTRHLLLNLFLTKFPGINFHRDISFGNGPWPCYNKASDHYLKLVVHDLTIRYSTRMKQKIGVFKCSCGVVYQQYKRFGGITNKEVTKIIDYGENWRMNFKTSYEKGNSIHLLSREFGVSLAIVKNAIKKLSRKTIQRPPISDNQDDQRVKFREMWERVLRDGDGKSPTEARKILPKVYYWLNAYDRSWLKIINTNYGFRSRKKQLRTNWQERDKMILKKLKAAHENLISSNYTKRITKTLLLRMISRYRYITKTKDLIWLPQSKTFIDKSVEDEKKYQLRRIKIAFDLLEDNKTYSKVTRSSGIKVLLPETKQRLCDLLNPNH